MWTKPLLASVLAGATLGCFLFRSAPPDHPAHPERERLLTALRRDLESRLKAVPGATGLWFYDLDTGDSIGLGEDRVFHAASVAKVFVLVEAFKRDYEGTVDLDAQVDLSDAFPGAVGGEPFRVSDCAGLARKVGPRASARKLCEEMISVSSNCAADNLIQLLGGPDAITQTAHALGAGRSKLPRYLMDEKAFEAGLNPETTPADIGRVMEQFARMQVVRPESSAEMVRILTLCRGGFLARDLPEDKVEIAHKTGAIDRVRHDAGFIRCENGTYVLAVLMQDLKDEKAGEDAGAAVSKACYDYIQKRPR